MSYEAEIFRKYFSHRKKANGKNLKKILEHWFRTPVVLGWNDPNATITKSKIWTVLILIKCDSMVESVFYTPDVDQMSIGDLVGNWWLKVRCVLVVALQFCHRWIFTIKKGHAVFSKRSKVWITFHWLNTV